MKIFKHLRSDWFRYGFETLAVIVGILIAFALDNWNEERKSGLLAVSLLEQFENRAPFNDSMKHHYVKMGWHEDFSVVSTAYQTIKSMGTENVTASELKKDIADHYDVAYIRLDKIIDRVNNSFANTNHELDLKHF
jgi:hypothetical protein